MSTELYANPTLFNRAMAERFEDFDLDASNNLSRFSFADVQGKVHQSICFPYMVEHLNERFGDFINPIKSIARRRMTVITYLEEGEGIEVVSKVAEEGVIQEKEALIVLSVEEVSSVDEVIEAKPEPDVDWEWLNSLKSTQVDKLTLDKYAEDRFGIKLNRGRKIDTMREDFKEALAAL